MNIKPLLTGILIGAVSIPTLAMGGSVVSSLIDGLSPSEAVNVLATQIDTLIGRVEVIETNIGQQQKEITRQGAYNKFKEVYAKVWLYGKTEEDTIRDTRFYCQKHIEEGVENSPFCPLADELEYTWKMYQNSLK